MIGERKAQITYKGDGTQKTYNFPFDYLRKAFIKITVVSSQKRNHLVQGKDYTVHNKQVTVKTAPTDIIEIYRKTTTEPLVTWQDASVLKAKDLSLQEIQLLHLAEETFDKVQDGGMARSERDNTWDGRYSRIKNIQEPKEDQDVLTLHWAKENKEGLLKALTETSEKQQKAINNLCDTQKQNLTGQYQTYKENIENIKTNIEQLYENIKTTSKTEKETLTNTGDIKKSEIEQTGNTWKTQLGADCYI